MDIPQLAKSIQELDDKQRDFGGAHFQTNPAGYSADPHSAS